MRIFRIVRVDMVVHSLELARSEVVEAVSAQVGASSWVNWLAFAENPEFYLARENYLAVFHLDRHNFPQFTAALRPDRGVQEGPALDEPVMRAVAPVAIRAVQDVVW